MSKYVAFLRGINVGGRIVRMSDLKTCFEAAGLRNVSTVLQTGNVVFESSIRPDSLKKLIEKKLTNQFHYSAKVQVILADDLAEIVRKYPFNEADNNFQHYVIFLENNLSDSLVPEMELDTSVEEVKAGKEVVYWKVFKGMTLKSPFAKLLVKTKYKEFNTTRSINTLKKLI